MNIIIFGIGGYYHDYKELLYRYNVIALIDNDTKKINKMMDGLIINHPEDVDLSRADYVVITLHDTEKAVLQLLSLGVEKTKIVRHCEISQCWGVPLVLHQGKQIITKEQWFEASPEKKILVLAQNFSKNGVAVVGMHTAMLIEKMGYRVIYGALRGGTLVNELQDSNLTYIEYIGISVTKEEELAFIQKFDCVFLCDLAVIEIWSILKKFSIPVFWWINMSYQEEYDYYDAKNRLPVNNPNVYFGADGIKIEKTFHRNFPDVKIKQLLYFLPESACPIKQEVNNPIYFGVIGKVGKRKAQDLVYDAFRMLPENIRNCIKIIFVGRDMMQLNLNLKEISRTVKEICYVEEMSQKELYKLYEELDVLICPSREDSGPVVVTQAFQYGMPCIVSDEVGQSEFMINGTGGWVFRSGNVQDLADKICEVVNNKDSILHRGMTGYDIYKRYFSEKAHQQNLEELFADIL